MQLERNTGEWLKGSGPESDIVISSRIRLARNIQGCPFRTKLDAEARVALEQKLRAAIAEAGLPDLEHLILYGISPRGSIGRMKALPHQLPGRLMRRRGVCPHWGHPCPRRAPVREGPGGNLLTRFVRLIGAV